MTPREILQNATKVVDYVNDIVPPQSVTNGEAAEIMLIAMQGLIGVAETARFIADRAPKVA
jgi:hypothetical protein